MPLPSLLLSGAGTACTYTRGHALVLWSWL